MMVNSFTHSTPAAVPILQKINVAPLHKVVVASVSTSQHQTSKLVHRRASTLGLAGLVLGLINVGSDHKRANAAGKRAPPPPPQEKKDPSMNAVTAKVLASKKRKEAMKESIAKLREKGKVLTEPSP